MSYYAQLAGILYVFKKGRIFKILAFIAGSKMVVSKTSHLVIFILSLFEVTPLLQLQIQDGTKRGRLLTCNSKLLLFI